MDNLTILQENWQVLSGEMVTLKILKDQVETRRDQQMGVWLQDVESNEREIEEIRKELNELNRKVVERLEAVKVLKAGSSTSIETLLIELAKGKPKRFSHEDLKRFTNDFDTNVGSGGFGVVYKGEFPSGVPIAVKVLAEQNVTEEIFMAEVRIMGMTNHRNLVKLYGFCFDSNMKGLVYEYMENGSLDKILYTKGHSIEWGKLYNIVIEAAIGISHLHDGCRERIIHHDIKPANILLDSNFSPKVADFGLAKLINWDVSHVTLTGPKGTRGYVAPEMTLMPFSHVTHKCDIYSFGMMMFDILGMRRINQNEEWFPKKVWEKFEKRQLDNMIEDCGIKGKDKESAKILSRVAFWCIQFTPEKRQPMSTVVKMLVREIRVPMPPNPFLPYLESITQPSREEYVDKVSGKEYVDKILAQHKNGNSKANSLPAEEDVNVLVKFAMQDNGFSHGKPVTAFIVYKCLLHWNSFESDEQSIFSIFDRLIQMIGSAIDNQDDKDHMSYWLSNTSMLLFFLNRSFKPTGPIQQSSHSSPAVMSLFQRMTRSRHSTPHAVNALDSVHQVEAGYPAIFFIKKILAYVEKLYKIIQDHLKNDLRSFLSLCIQASRGKSSSKAPIINILNMFLMTLQDNFVPSLLIQNIFSQTFYHINVQIFNSLLSLPKPCTRSQAMYLKAGFDELELWCDTAKEEYAGSSWDELKHARQAIGFYALPDKSRISLDEITQEMCPTLNIQQVCSICTPHWSNMSDTLGLSSDVISQLRKLSEKNPNNGNGPPLLLETSSQFPFSVDDISTSLEKADFSNITLDVELLNHPAFQFLQK